MKKIIKLGWPLILIVGFMTLMGTLKHNETLTQYEQQSILTELQRIQAQNVDITE